MSEVVFHQIYRETMNRLSSYSRRVAEGRDVMAASEFARWLNFSGIVRLLMSNPQDPPLKVDGAFMQWTLDQLLEHCNERFRTNRNDPSFTPAEFQSLHDKIDLMAGYLSRLSVAPAVSVNPLPREAVEFNIISGGLDEELRSERPPMSLTEKTA
jgi:hypothetical protein